MPPVKRLTPRNFEIGSMLIKHMIIPLEINKPIRVVHPPFSGSVMHRSGRENSIKATALCILNRITQVYHKASQFQIKFTVYQSAEKCLSSDADSKTVILSVRRESPLVLFDSPVVFHLYQGPKNLLLVLSKPFYLSFFFSLRQNNSRTPIYSKNTPKMRRNRLRSISDAT